MDTQTTQSNEIIMIPDGYDRRQYRRMVRVRRMTLDEIKSLQSGSHVEFIAADGTLRRAKVNGAVKTWKTDPRRVEIPLKYGMYNYGRLSTAEALGILVVRAPEIANHTTIVED